MKKFGRCQNGAAAVATVIFLPVALLLASLVLDVGRLLLAKRNLSLAADMGALAGAQELDLGALWYGKRVLLESAARSTARETVEANIQANLPGWQGLASACIVATVYNAEKGCELVHPGTRRILQDPTVCITVKMPIRLSVVPGPPGGITVSTHADASVLGKKRVP
ncbi:MAG TPA: hypothetical protein GXX40_05085 [Firmicutes bacterium]|nr:hypothetical protein [Bacillota bacterium]